MEPMTLGSPTGSPVTNTSQYLPSFLMGESQIPAPRNSTLSPNNAGRNISFGASPSSTLSHEFNRSPREQKTLFGYQQATPTSSNCPGTPFRGNNGTLSGPPTQGLFDSLKCERNQLQTPKRSGNLSHLQPYATSVNQQGIQQQQLHDSYLSNNSFNASRFTSPLSGVNPHCTPIEFRSTSAGSGGPLNTSNFLHCPPIPRYTDLWVTVYGFTPNAASIILQHFAQCGTILEKVIPTSTGNWMHLKFTSRLECDKALSYNEKIIGDNIMIGVTPCKDKNIIDKENICENNTPTKVRPLAQTAFRSTQNDCAVMVNPSVPQKTSGLMNKAIDLFFGW